VIPVSIGLSDEHLALAESVRRFLEARCGPPVVRAAVDAETDALPPFWPDAAEMGWPALHLPEDAGGQGYGLAELAVVLEELGRAMAPGPFLPTVWAAAAIRDGGGHHQKRLAGLATGQTVATVALTAPLPGRTRPGGGVAVSGSLGPVLSGTLADVAVVPVDVDGDGDERWFVLPASSFEATPVDSLDPTRRLATLTVAGAELDDGQALPALDRRRVRALAATLVAAECAGIADWCTRTAAAYATVREQFGRPIGQFQGVKHRCADMLVATEQARSVAWDAAHALDSDAGGGAGLAAAVAGAVAPDAAVRVAKDCIQVLGGIGFTWEHDAHLYLRRATSLRQLLGGPSPWRREVATAALGGQRRRPEIALPPGAEAEGVRDEVRRFTESVAGLPADEQRRRLVDERWLVPHWPPPWGRGAGAAEQLVVDEELRRARIRRPHLQVGTWAAPTIAVHGTPEQQERWVRPTLLGTIRWCQLFSEPGAGSDLAALTTAATRTGGGWLLNGQKVWTSMAREADWGICLVRTENTGSTGRTDSRAPKHRGITYVIVDMRAPGIDVRPLREMTGLEMFNEVFLTDVFVPDDCVIGEVGGGWPLARTTLANERVSMGSGSSFGGGVEALLSLVAERRSDTGAGHPETDDALLLDQVGATVAEAQTVTLLGARSTQRSLSGAAPGAESSVRKLLGVEHDQRTQELGLALLGPEGATTVGAAGQWTFGFLANRCLTIAGGTSEIQRNVIAERLLGLPRDP
jgi:alkylation response protein AidB-like acyl-CoA dehydrogenase